MGEQSKILTVFFELRRRHVVRVVAIYAAFAWVLTQVADVFLPALRAPAWIMTSIISLVIIGFPVVAILAWLFDVDAGGVVRTKPRSRTGVFAIVIAIVILAGTTALFTLAVIPASEESTTLDNAFDPMPDSVAVLPFVDLSPEMQTGYLADGVPDLLIHQLSNVPGINVIARTTAFSFKGESADIRDIGQLLNVESVLEGSVRQIGEKIRVATQLVDVRSGTNVWSGQFEPDDTDIFLIQDEIAASVVESVTAALVGDYRLPES